VRLFIPALEDEDGAPRVVGEVVHARSENSTIGRLREKAHAAQTAGRDVDVQIRGHAECDGLPRGIAKCVGGSLCGGAGANCESEGKKEQPLKAREQGAGFEKKHAVV